MDEFDDAELRREAAQWRKAAKMAALLWRHGVGPEATKVMTAAQWRDLARLAGVRPPSARTVALVRDLAGTLACDVCGAPMAALLDGVPRCRHCQRDVGDGGY